LLFTFALVVLLIVSLLKKSVVLLMRLYQVISQHTPAAQQMYCRGILKAV